MFLMLERLLAWFFLFASLACVCIAFLGLLRGNLRAAEVGMLLASPCYLFMAFLFCCMVLATIVAASCDRKAQRIAALLADGPRVGVVGGAEFRHAESKQTCEEVGRLLAAVPNLLLLIGESEGTGEVIGRSFFQARRTAGIEPRVYHLVPQREPGTRLRSNVFHEC